MLNCMGEGCLLKNDSYQVNYLEFVNKDVFKLFNYDN